MDGLWAGPPDRRRRKSKAAADHKCQIKAEVGRSLDRSVEQHLVSFVVITIHPFGVGSNSMSTILMADARVGISMGSSPGGFPMDASFVDRTRREWRMLTRVGVPGITSSRPKAYG